MVPKGFQVFTLTRRRKVSFNKIRLSPLSFTASIPSPADASNSYITGSVISLSLAANAAAGQEIEIFIESDAPQSMQCAGHTDCRGFQYPSVTALASNRIGSRFKRSRHSSSMACVALAPIRVTPISRHCNRLSMSRTPPAALI